MSNDRPTHEISVDGDRVIIRNLELFVGYIPGFDDPEDSIKGIGPKEISKIVQKTQKHMDAKSNPKLVLLHDKDGETTPTEAIGDIISIKEQTLVYECQDGTFEGPGIVGDVEMSRQDFDRTIGSNCYPRRSSELWADGHLSEVALLGRTTPARPLPDTKFSRTGTKKVFDRPMIFEMVSPGGSNTFTPGLIKTKDADMDPKEEIKKITAERDALDTELKALKKKMEKDDPEDDPEKNLFEEDDDDDDDKKKPNKATFAKVSKTKEGKKVVSYFSKLETKISKQGTQITGLSDMIRKQNFERTLDQMNVAGYPVEDNREHMLSELMDCNDPKEKFEFWKKTMQRVPVGDPLFDTRDAVTGAKKSKFSAEEKQRATVKVVAKMFAEKIDSKQYESLFQKELRNPTPDIEEE